MNDELDYNVRKNICFRKTTVTSYALAYNDAPIDWWKITEKKDFEYSEIFQIPLDESYLL